MPEGDSSFDSNNYRQEHMATLKSCPSFALADLTHALPLSMLANVSANRTPMVPPLFMRECDVHAIVRCIPWLLYTDSRQ